MCISQQSKPGGTRPTRHPVIQSTETAVLRFWEIEHFFRCPLIGICLTPAEQRQVLKKSGFCLKGKSPYDIHEMLVAAAESENRLSRKVDRLLTRNFGLGAAALHKSPERDFMRCWKAALESGQYFTEFWAAVSRCDLSITARKKIFGDIHMAMHANADQTAHAARRLAHIQSKVTRQARRIKELSQEGRASQKENQALKRTLSETNKTLDHMLAGVKFSLLPAGQKRFFGNTSAGMKMQRLTLNLEQENQRLRATVADQAGQIEARDRELASLTARIARISKTLEDQKQAEALFRKETQEALRAFFEMNRCDANCPAFDLCSKRVLIVGGISRMEALYRQLIENSGGVFEYHDGYMKGGSKRLESRLKRSDIVLCPVNCNSHAACNMVKNLGKKHNKPVHMLANFSLSAVSQVIQTNGIGKAAASN